jgi:hypothetical protein
MFVTFSVVLLLFLGTSCVAAQRQCNGFAQLCDRSLGNITFIGAHDSFAYDSGSTGSTVGVGISSTQYNNVSQQLTDGVRMLQGQGHRLENSGDSEVYLCHTSCALLNGGTLTDYLKKVVTFLDDNPNEVIILLWVNTVGDRLPVSDYGDSYKASGLDKYSYIPSETPVRIDAWPTLGQLISEGKRAITFMDKGADLDSVPYILDEYSMIFETVPNPQNNNFPCQMRNSSGGDSPDGRMYLVNHNLNRKVSSSIVVPDVGKVNTTNAACGEHTIGQQVDNCVALYDRNPNIIMLDCKLQAGHRLARQRLTRQLRLQLSSQGPVRGGGLPQRCWAQPMRLGCTDFQHSVERKQPDHHICRCGIECSGVCNFERSSNGHHASFRCWKRGVG